MVISQMRENPVYNPVNEPIVFEPQNVEFIRAPSSLDNLDEDDEDEEDEEDDDEDEEDDEDEDDKIVVSDDDDGEEETPLIKLINIPFSENANSLTDTIEISEETIEEEEYTSENDISEVDMEPIEEHFEQDVPVITVNKVSEHETHAVESEEEKVLEEKDAKETKESEEVNYQKMSIYNLKNLVVSRGLATDSSKLKKPQLIQLLESSD
jgi:hypothetical protein